MASFASSAGAGEHKWIGLDIATNLKSIVGATWNGYEMTQADEDEATGLGLPKGHIVYWAAAENLPATVTIEDATSSITLNFVFNDR